MPLPPFYIFLKRRYLEWHGTGLSDRDFEHGFGLYAYFWHAMTRLTAKLVIQREALFLLHQYNTIGLLLFCYTTVWLEQFYQFL